MPDLVALTPIDALPAVRALRDSAWFDAVRALHLLGVSLLVGGVLAFDLRVLGVGRGLAPRPLARFLLPIVLVGFALAAASGVLLFVTRASELMTSALFLTKLGIVFAMGVNAAGFHLLAWKDVEHWTGGPAPTLARLFAALSALGWLAVLGCGVVLGAG